jgi:hypothetical protein
MSFTTTVEDTAQALYLLENCGGKIKTLLKEKQLLMRNLGACITLLLSSSDKNHSCSPSLINSLYNSAKKRKKEKDDNNEEESEEVIPE